MNAVFHVDHADRAARRATRAGRATLRMVCALALIPIVPATAGIGTSIISSQFTGPGFDDFRCFQLIFSILWIAATILIWRRAIVWTLGRRWLTAMISLIPFVQVVYNLPLWNAGCISDDVLRVGQHQASVGLWTWLAVWAWWGAEKLTMSRHETKQNGEASQRLPIERRVAASIGMFPLVFGVYFIVSVVTESPLGMSFPLSTSLTFTVTAVVALFVWCLLWRGTVEWSESVAWRTIGAWLLMVAGPIALQFALLGKLGGAWETTVVSLPVIGWGLWLAWTVWYWPIRVELIAPSLGDPHCLKCGYSLRGLSATRCPECGNAPTLDELWRGLQNTP